MECPERRFVALFELLVDDLPSRAVFIALESRGQSAAKLLDQPLHRRRQPGATPRRQLQAIRLLRINKVVDVAPVGRRRLALGLLPQQIFDQRVPAGAGRSERIDIVALALHSHGEPDGLDRALLTDQIGRLFQLAAKGEGEFRRVAAAVQ